MIRKKGGERETERGIRIIRPICVSLFRFILYSNLKFVAILLIPDHHHHRFDAVDIAVAVLLCVGCIQIFCIAIFPSNIVWCDAYKISIVIAALFAFDGPFTIDSRIIQLFLFYSSSLSLFPFHFQYSISNKGLRYRCWTQFASALWYCWDDATTLLSYWFNNRCNKDSDAIGSWEDSTFHVPR